ncbi:MAG: glycosyltransferase family 4 protein [Desulfobacterales bacterium]|nr:MAG: glycosyltransferase family 4 protein [Desulfobacterales bacterium]
MNESHKGYPTKNVGFISTRLAGTDGVSLETKKWADVFDAEGYQCFYFGGELDRPPEVSYLVGEAHFSHPEIAEIYQGSFDVEVRDRFLSEKIHKIARYLKDHLYAFIDRFEIGLIIPQNALTIPMNIPLGLAITQVIMETGIPTIAHHHDFYWERDRFMTNAVWDYLTMAFPPKIPSVHHVVINSFADEQLSLRTGISARIIPNVMDFENPPPAPDKYASDVRQALGIEDDELFVLQPTRVVQRKGIEHAIELVHRLGMKAKLVISHASGDEGYDYEQRLREYTELMKVNTVFVSDIITEQRGTTPDGRKIYTLEDIFPHADLVTYPSTFEGFGNAFLEAIYFRKPVAVNFYSVYAKDIKPKGFAVIELDGFVTAKAVRRTKEILDNPGLCREIVDHNYEIARQYFSYEVLHRHLHQYIEEHSSALRALRHTQH